MNVMEMAHKVKKKGVKGIWLHLTKKKEKPHAEQKRIKLLLLTNRDSDNVGNQIIEACDIALLSTIMKNMNFKEEQFEIVSRAASIVSKQYIARKDKSLLKSARKAIGGADIVIFGGAPVFNYQYQIFYERTATTLEIAKEAQKPVIFSAIGIEGYDEQSEKCRRLKETLNFDCVKQITTRDGLDFLLKYREREDLVVKRVSDPAVFCAPVFRENTLEKRTKSRKKIGIFILRAYGFVDNKVNFSREDAAHLWTSLICELQDQGYDYELLTSGHFADEAFMDSLIRDYGVKANKCVFNMNMPERLVQKISSYDAVVSCRLHPSIISFSLGVPSLGIAWNPKVRGFYDSIGYADRVVDVNGINAHDIVCRLETAIGQGVEKNPEYLNSIYTSLFCALKNLLRPEEAILPYSYDEVMANIPVYQGTSADELEKKLQRKFRRAYGSYNEKLDKLEKKKRELKELTGDIHG